jgi:hypothetical protein
MTDPLTAAPVLVALSERTRIDPQALASALGPNCQVTSVGDLHTLGDDVGVVTLDGRDLPGLPDLRRRRPSLLILSLLDADCGLEVIIDVLEAGADAVLVGGNRAEAYARARTLVRRYRDRLARQRRSRDLLPA